MTWEEGPASRIVALGMHMSIASYSFPIRVVVHLTWNCMMFHWMPNDSLFKRTLVRLDDWLRRRLGISTPSVGIMHGDQDLEISDARPCANSIPSSPCSLGGLMGTNIPPASLNSNVDSSSVTEQATTLTVVADSSLPSFDSLVPRFGRKPQPDSFEDFVSQPVRVHHMTWTGVTPQTTVVTEDLFSLWKSTAPVEIQRKFDNLFYGRGTLRLTVVVQGASQMCGQLVISAYPRPRYPTTVGRRVS